jgi:hypothetical protein
LVEADPGRSGGEQLGLGFFTRIRGKSGGRESCMVSGGTDVVDSEGVRERYDELRAAGYGWGCALILASSPGVDLDLARTLLARGCPQATAVRILL